MQFYLTIILLILVLEFVWSQYLSYRNRKRMSPHIPLRLEGIYDKEDYARQQEYQKVNSRFGLYINLFSFAMMVVVLSFGLFGWLDEYLRQFIDNEILLTLAFIGIIYVVNEIITLPFDYYATFVIEERFGFNKSTKSTFWFDQLKGLLLVVAWGGRYISPYCLAVRDIGRICMALCMGSDHPVFTVYVVVLFKCHRTYV